MTGPARPGVRLRKRAAEEYTEAERAEIAASFPARNQRALDRALDFDAIAELRQSAAQHYTTAEFYETLIKARFDRGENKYAHDAAALERMLDSVPGKGDGDRADLEHNGGYDALVAVYKGGANTADTASIDPLVELAIRERAEGDKVAAILAKHGVDAREAESVTYGRAMQLVALLATFCEVIRVDWRDPQIRAAAQTAVAAAAAVQSDVMLDGTGVGVLQQIADLLQQGATSAAGPTIPALENIPTREEPLTVEPEPDGLEVDPDDIGDPEPPPWAQG